MGVDGDKLFSLSFNDIIIIIFIIIIIKTSEDVQWG